MIDTVGVLPLGPLELVHLVTKVTHLSQNLKALGPAGWVLTHQMLGPLVGLQQRAISLDEQ